MKLKSLSFAAATAAVFGLLTATGSAQTQTTSAVGDLFIGFRALGDEGVSSNYLIKIGQASLFRDAAPGSSFSLTLGNIGADLTSLYGSSWYTRSDLLWSISGGNTTSSAVAGDPRRTLYYLNYTGGPAWNAVNYAGMAEAAGDMGAQRARYLQGPTGTAVLSTINSTVGIIQDASVSNSYGSFQVGGNVTSAYGTFSGGGENNFGLGVSGANLDLFRLVSQSGADIVPGTLIGTFSISNSGVVTFTAVPEPSQIALLGLAAFAFLGVAALRRSHARRNTQA